MGMANSTVEFKDTCKPRARERNSTLDECPEREVQRQDASKPTRPGSQILAGEGKPKGILRMIEKMATEHVEAKIKDVRYLVDLSRNEIVAKSVRGLVAVLQELLRMHATGVIRLVRCKNRFQEPTLGGWADIVLNACFVDDPHLHVFELQLVHEKLSIMRKQ